MRCFSFCISLIDKFADKMDKNSGKFFLKIYLNNILPEFSSKVSLLSVSAVCIPWWDSYVKSTGWFLQN